MKKVLYTIGYTLFKGDQESDVTDFFNCLKNYKIDYLVDVRSIPFSKQYPLFNGPNLKSAGKFFKIPYVHMPELGAKADPSQDVFSCAEDIFYEDAVFPIAKSNRPEKTVLNLQDKIVDFNKFVHADNFLEGIHRIETAYDKGFTLALMCSEKYPIDCHRYFLISKSVEQKFGDYIEVKHITKNVGGRIELIDNSKLNDNLMDTVLKKKPIQKLNVQSVNWDGTSVLDKYVGKNQLQQLFDFCYRYWNLLHGWKVNDGIEMNYEYD